MFFLESNIEKIIQVIITTFIPVFELRVSIPLGLSLGLPLHLVFFIAVTTNFFVGLIVLIALNLFLSFFLKIKQLKKFYELSIERAQKKSKPLMDKFGWIGLALFIAIPLPGSGVYTGALIAFITNMSFKKFVLADFIGVLIAAIIVSIISFFGLTIFGINV